MLSCDWEQFILTVKIRLCHDRDSKNAIINNDITAYIYCLITKHKCVICYNPQLKVTFPALLMSDLHLLLLLFSHTCVQH